MTGTVVSLQTRADGASALARIDVAAIELLAEGRAATLSVARIDVILANLVGQRAELVAVIAELSRRPSSGNTRIDALNADLRVAARDGLVQIDLFIEQTQTCAAAAHGERALT